HLHAPLRERPAAQHPQARHHHRLLAGLSFLLVGLPTLAPAAAASRKSMRPAMLESSIALWKHGLIPMPQIKLAPLFALALTLAPGLASAAPPPEEPDIPEGTTTQTPATTGTTELAPGDTFTTADEVAAEDAPPDSRVHDMTQLDLSLGGVFSTGNSRTLAFTGLANFRMRRTRHLFGASLAGNYGAAGVEGADRFETTIGNIQGLAR